MIKDKNNILTKQKYLYYINKATHSQSTEQIRNLLYTFLSYYRHLGVTPTLTEKGQDYMQIVNAFQQVIGNYNLKRPLTQINTRELKLALQASLKVMSLWFYTTISKTKRIVIDATKMKNAQQVIQKVNQVQDKIVKNKDLCLYFSVGKKQIVFIIVPHQDLIVP